MEIAFGQLDALDQRLERRVGRGALFGGKAFHRAGEVVGDGEHIAGEGADAVGARVGDFAFGASTQVLHLRQRRC